jgi:hypothetical protein
MLARAIPIAVLLLSLSSDAAAQEGDGAYGRLDHDVIFSVGVGGGFVVDGPSDGMLLAEVRARYLDMVGVLVAPEWQVDAIGRLIVAVEMRPLWPARFLLNGFSGNEWLDLFLESVSVELGAAILPLTDQVGAGLAIGLGLDVPILVPSIFADGLMLHLGARHVRAGPSDQAAPVTGGVSDWTFAASLVVKFGADLGIAAREMPRYTVD